MPPPIDIVYLFCHSKQGDEELRYSLRSVARGAAWVRKVWVLGDRPAWLNDDTSVVEHVSHEYLARPWALKLPVRNAFWLTFLGSLIPGLTFDNLWFSDDFILLREVQPHDLLQVRAIEDMAQATARGRGVWKDGLWRTHDTLVRLGYGSLNFEVHVPVPNNKQLIWEAFCEFQDYVSQDRWFGLYAHTAIFNYAIKHWGLRFPSQLPTEPAAGKVAPWPLVWLREESQYAGFHTRQPTYDQVRAQTARKTFLNFDDAAYGPALQAFLAEQFPGPSKYERFDVDSVAQPSQGGLTLASEPA